MITSPAVPIPEKIIGIYGSSATQPDSPLYRDAVRLGVLLAQAGHAVMTGGYAGMMGAISEGAASVNGHVIGVTVGFFKARGLTPNKHLVEQIELPTLAERLNYLIIKPDAYIFLHGGIGTLAELALAWSLVQVGELPHRPLVCIGELWRRVADDIVQYGAIRPVDKDYLILVDTVDEVIPALSTWWANPPKIAPKIGDGNVGDGKTSAEITPLLGDLPIEPPTTVE